MRAGGIVVDDHRRPLAKARLAGGRESLATLGNYATNSAVFTLKKRRARWT